MAKQTSRKTSKTKKRAGTAFWLADQDGDLLRAVAKAEDRPLQTIMRRALLAYASASKEYLDVEGSD